MSEPEWLHQIERLVKAYAKAKADRVHLEQFRKSKKALLMTEAETLDSKKYKSAAAQEVYAYGHSEYLELLEGIKAATALEVECQWNLKQREWKFETYRTEQANQRAERSRYGA